MLALRGLRYTIKDRIAIENKQRRETRQAKCLKQMDYSEWLTALSLPT